MNVRKVTGSIVLSLLLLESCSSADILFKYVVIDATGPADPHTKTVGDINGDGFVDIVVASSKGGPLVWYEFPGWAKHVVAPLGRWSCDAEVADVDRDGDKDIVISEWYAKNEMEWYENPGPTGDPRTAPWALHVIGSPRAHDVELGDFDGDGDLDMVTRDQGNAGNAIRIWRQETPSAWKQRVVPCPTGEGLTIGDVDGDRRPEVVIGGRWYDTPTDVIEGAWTEHIFAGNWHPACVVQVHDVNQDGRADVVVSPSEGTFRLSWFEAPLEPTAGNWPEHVVENSIEGAHSLQVGDMDNDGDPEVATAKMHQSKAPQEVSVYINEGKGLAWKKQVLATTGSHNLRLADVGNDGDLDIVGANWSGGFQPVELWENLVR